MQIEPFDNDMLEPRVGLSLRAWVPVFRSIEAAMGAEVFREQHPDGRWSADLDLASVRLGGEGR